MYAKFASQQSKGKAQNSAAPEEIILAHEKQRLEEIDALIRTMSLWELVAIVMLDAEDSNDHSTTDEEKIEYMRYNLSNIELEEQEPL